MDIRQLFEKAIQTATENANYDYVITMQDSRDATRWLQITWDAVNVQYPFTETPDQLLLRLGLVLPDGMGVSDWTAMKSLTLWHSATNLETMAAFVRDYLVKAFGMSTDVGSWQIKEITGQQYQSTGQPLISLVLEYATVMNAIERDINERSDAAPGQDLFPEFEVRYKSVFEAYTSKKCRVYGGKAQSYGKPVKFDGIETAIESTAILKNKSRAEVYFKTANMFRAEYLFVLLKEAGEWKIDNAKYRWYNAEKWNPLIL